MAEHLKSIHLKVDDHLIERAATWPVVGAPARWLHEALPAATEHAWIRSGTENLIGTAGAAGRDLLVGAGAGLADLSLALFLLFFILRDGPGMIAKVEGFVPLEAPVRRQLLNRIEESVRAVVFGTGVTAALQGVMVGAGFAVCRLPAPVVFALLAGVLALLPTGGAGIVWVPGVIALFAQDRAAWAIGLALWGILISLSDNFVRPLLVSTKVPISTLVVFIGAIGGVAGFGMVGLVLGPVLMSLCATLLDFAEKFRSATEDGIRVETPVL
jgi:predicted PurR-regulated permease PerM